MFFKDEYYFLSNMYPCKITIHTHDRLYSFACVESAFQAFKCPERFLDFVYLDGYKAKALGKTVKLRPDWEEVKYSIMKDLIKIKFTDNPELTKLLLQTKGNIIEDNNHGDTFWGVCNGKGANNLGDIITEYRNSLIKSQTCCFTGRRPKYLFGYTRELYLPLMEKLKEDILMLYKQGYTKFISGGAQGFDQLAFWAVNALKRDMQLPVMNVVYVPFKGQELAWKKTGLFSQSEYNLMLSFADEVVYLNWNTGYELPSYFKHQPLSIDNFNKIQSDIKHCLANVKINNKDKWIYLKAKETPILSITKEYYIPVVDTRSDIKIIAKALNNRNHEMVNASSLVYGLYPDYSWTMPRTKGGTVECLKYAMNNNKKIYQLSNETLRSAEHKY